MDKSSKHKIFWLEDDLHSINSLLYFLDKDDNFSLESFDSIHAAAEKLESVSKNYFDLIIIDLLVSSSDMRGRKPSWLDIDIAYGANGIGLIKFARERLKLCSPILILSILENPDSEFELQNFEPIHILNKQGLTPSKTFKFVKKILENEKNSLL